MTKRRIPSGSHGLPWEEAGNAVPVSSGKCGHMDSFQGTEISISAVSRLIDRMVMDIQHLELEVIRERYRLSFYLPDPYDVYLKMEIFSSLGGRYAGDPVYDEYLRYRGFNEYDDAIDTPFHVKRKQRLADGYDDFPYLYP